MLCLVLIGRSSSSWLWGQCQPQFLIHCSPTWCLLSRTFLTHGLTAFIQSYPCVQNKFPSFSLQLGKLHASGSLCTHETRMLSEQRLQIMSLGYYLSVPGQKMLWPLHVLGSMYPGFLRSAECTVPNLPRFYCGLGPSLTVFVSLHHSIQNWSFLQGLLYSLWADQTNEDCVEYFHMLWKGAKLLVHSSYNNLVYPWLNLHDVQILSPQTCND